MLFQGLPIHLSVQTVKQGPTAVMEQPCVPLVKRTCTLIKDLVSVNHVTQKQNTQVSIKKPLVIQALDTDNLKLLFDSVVLIHHLSNKSPSVYLLTHIMPNSYMMSKI